MGWIAFSIAVLGTIYFAIHSSGFRKFLLAAMFLAGALGAIFWYNDYQKHYQRQLLIEEARKRIKPGDVELVEATLSLGLIGKLQGSITNHSAQPINHIYVFVSVYDCAKDAFYKPNCNTIGQKTIELYGLSIPIGQKRGFDQYVDFPNLPKIDKWSWNGFISSFDPVID